MKHHIESAIILLSFLALGMFALFGVGTIVLAMEACSH
jgi:hypothetical protein